MKLLITGMACSGKTTIANELKRVGVNAVDIEVFCEKNYKNHKGWNVDLEEIKKLLVDDSIVLVGACANINDVIGLVDKTIFLRVSDEVLKSRLLERAKTSPEWESRVDYVLSQKNAYFNRLKKVDYVFDNNGGVEEILCMIKKVIE